MSYHNVNGWYIIDKFVYDNSNCIFLQITLLKFQHHYVYSNEKIFNKIYLPILDSESLS